MTAVVGVETQRRTALVLYGSETGNAQDAAEELGKITTRLHFLTQVSELNAVDLDNLCRYTIVLLAISTTGQGDLPVNAQKFWKSLLRKRLPPNYLQNVRFTTFGLGDTSYPKFNWAVKKVHKRLCQLGAEEIYPRGEGDERHPEGIDGSFLPWSLDLRKHLLQYFPLPPGTDPISDDILLQPKWILEFAENIEDCDPELWKPTHDDGSTHSNGEKSTTLLALPDNITPPQTILPIPDSVTVTVTLNERVTPSSHWQDVRHLKFATQSPVSYGSGDILSIYPKNFPEDVDQLLDLMGWTEDAERPVVFIPTTAATDLTDYPPLPVSNLLSPPNLTLRSLLTNYLDITAIPRRSFFSIIAHFTKDEMHRERLLEFTNPEYVEELYDYTTRPRRSILEVLQEFESVKIPWQWAATVLPILRPRQFSIASGGVLKNPVSGSNGLNNVELLVAIVKYRTVIKKIRQGVCTRYLASLSVGSQLSVTLQKGGLHISRAEIMRPVIMIGPGTGVAPMRSMLWERALLAHELQDSKAINGGEHHPIGESVLFFGCRNKDADFFFQDDWATLKEAIGLKVFAAFSRDQRQKVYVQDVIREQSSLIFKLLHDSSGVVYICGSSGKMPQAVREALIESFQKEGAVDREAAEAYLMGMEKAGRYKQETW